MPTPEGNHYQATLEEEYQSSSEEEGKVQTK